MRVGTVVFSVLIMCILFSCRKDDDTSYVKGYYPPPPEEPATIDSLYHISFDLDGVNYSDSVTGENYSPACGLWGTVASTTTMTYVSVLSPQVEGLPKLRFGKGILTFPYGTLTMGQFAEYFDPDQYQMEANDTNRVYFSMVYNDSINYSSRFGPQTETNIMEILQVDQKGSPGGQHEIRVHFNFNCTLYNELDSLDTRQISNGYMVAPFKAIAH